MQGIPTHPYKLIAPIIIAIGTRSMSAHRLSPDTGGVGDIRATDIASVGVITNLQVVSLVHVSVPYPLMGIQD